jgi:hypothetical protein
VEMYKWASGQCSTHMYGSMDFRYMNDGESVFTIHIYMYGDTYYVCGSFYINV